MALTNEEREWFEQFKQILKEQNLGANGKYDFMRVNVYSATVDDDGEETVVKEPAFMREETGEDSEAEFREMSQFDFGMVEQEIGDLKLIKTAKKSVDYGSKEETEYVENFDKLVEKNFYNPLTEDVSDEKIQYLYSQFKNHHLFLDFPHESGEEYSNSRQVDNAFFYETKDGKLALTKSTKDISISHPYAEFSQSAEVCGFFNAAPGELKTEREKNFKGFIEAKYGEKTSEKLKGWNGDVEHVPTKPGIWDRFLAFLHLASDDTVKKIKSYDNYVEADAAAKEIMSDLKKEAYPDVEDPSVYIEQTDNLAVNNSERGLFYKGLIGYSYAKRAIKVGDRVKELLNQDDLKDKELLSDIMIDADNTALTASARKFCASVDSAVRSMRYTIDTAYEGDSAQEFYSRGECQKNFAKIMLYRLISYDTEERDGGANILDQCIKGGLNPIITELEKGNEDKLVEAFREYAKESGFYNNIEYATKCLEAPKDDIHDMLQDFTSNIDIYMNKVSQKDGAQNGTKKDSLSNVPEKNAGKYNNSINLTRILNQTEFSVEDVGELKKYSLGRYKSTKNVESFVKFKVYSATEKYMLKEQAKADKEALMKQNNGENVENSKVKIDKSKINAEISGIYDRVEKDRDIYDKIAESNVFDADRFYGEWMIRNEMQGKADANHKELNKANELNQAAKNADEKDKQIQTISRSHTM